MPVDSSPIFTIGGFDGQQVPFYGLTFDKHGNCTSPQTREAVVNLIRSGGYTDTILYSHGWNNDWNDAVDLYSAFLSGVGQQSSLPGTSMPPGIKPLMLGVSWPSAALVWPWEEGPDLAGTPGRPGEDDAKDAALLAEEIAASDAVWLRDLAAGNSAVGHEDLRRIAELLAPQLAALDPDEPTDGDAFDASDLARRFMVPELRVDGTGSGTGSFDPVATAPAAEVEEPATAGDLFSGLFGVRKILRLATVLKMKDRAGTVGRNGVADTVALLLAQTPTRLHLVGHSYGCKVLMTALCSRPLSRRAESTLLLQPAVNFLAFAPNVLGRPGGFRKALDRVSKPILVTQSADDFPLRRIFHLAARRKSDLAEPEAAGTPSQWSAMGGYGPANLAAGEAKHLRMPMARQPYPDVGASQIIALEATGLITSHSDVSNSHTFWAMLQNLR